MKCTTQIQANRVAEIGFKKMTGYTIEQSHCPVLYRVINPDGEVYHVNRTCTSCTCKFWEENEEFRTCKHCLFLNEFLENEALIAQFCPPIDAETYEMGAKY